MRRLEQAARSYFAGPQYAGGGITAVDYHQAVPVVVTELERITADPVGAAGKVRRRPGREVTLGRRQELPSNEAQAGGRASLSQPPEISPVRGSRRLVASAGAAVPVSILPG
jgi:hypothetical protein